MVFVTETGKNENNLPVLLKNATLAVSGTRKL